MQELIQAAQAALTSKEAAFIIGYALTPDGKKTRPFIARTPDEAAKLVFNHTCAHNLAVYLTRIAKPKEGKMGIVAKGCDTRAIVALIQENKITREQVYIIGVNCSGVAADVTLPFGTDNLPSKCIMCQVQVPPVQDVLVGTAAPYGKPKDAVTERMQLLEAMSERERFAFWAAEFEKCIKCYACRQTCPMCYCEQCIVDKTVPRWIESSASLRGNFSWNMIRAFHLAGRCIGCGECERACPMDIPLMLLNRKMGMIAMQKFNYRHGVNPEEPTLVGSYNMQDNNEFFK